MNRSGNQNRSVRNTKRRLHEGLLQLMEQRPIQEISVKELTELVDVNRGTFYFHYPDLYALLREMEESFFEAFRSTLRETIPTGSFAYHDYLGAVFSFLDENRSFCRIMLGPNGDMQFVERVKGLVDDTISYFWQMKEHDADPAKYEMYNVFIINGCIGLIQKWLTDPERTSPEEMARMAATIVMESVNACIA